MHGGREGPVGDEAKKPEEQAGWMGVATKTAAVLAVLAALSNAQQSSSNLDAILEQGKVNDTWSYFQAKSEKQHTAASLSALAKALGGATPTPEVTAFVTSMDSLAAHELDGKNEAEATARDYEHARDKCVEKGFWFEIAFAMLQLGVILSTVALGAKKPSILAGSVSLGLLGAVLIVNAYVRVIPMPDIAKVLAPKLAAKVPGKKDKTAPTPEGH
jgi:hypothetical protein